MIEQGKPPVTGEGKKARMPTKIKPAQPAAMWRLGHRRRMISCPLRRHYTPEGCTPETCALPDPTPQGSGVHATCGTRLPRWKCRWSDTLPSHHEGLSIR